MRRKGTRKQPISCASKWPFYWLSGMTFKTAISSTQLSLGRLVRLAGAAEPSGTYTICMISMAPAFVLTRLLDVLGILDPDAHARLTGPGGLYRTIPSAAMDDAESSWWSGPDGSALIGGITSRVSCNDHRIADFQRFASHASAAQLTGRGPLDVPSLFFAVFTDHCDMKK